VEELAAERTEVLGPTARIGTLNPCDPFRAVGTLEKSLDGFGDARQAAATQAARVVRIVDAWGRGLRFEGQRIGHRID
jgi:hypothetical protein